MKRSELKKISKYFSLVLRHKPSVVGITLDRNGWVKVEEMIAKTTAFDLSFELIETVVVHNDKQRFVIELRDGYQWIRANQGHSVEVDLNLTAVKPPDVLYHGTAQWVIGLISVQGINKQKRHHVHLSSDIETAIAVGGRHGKPALIKIDAKLMYEDGNKFYKSENGVWLTDHVAAAYFSF